MLYGNPFFRVSVMLNYITQRSTEMSCSSHSLQTSSKCILVYVLLGSVCRKDRPPAHLTEHAPHATSLFVHLYVRACARPACKCCTRGVLHSEVLIVGSALLQAS